ncbi:MAG: PP2C family serine/threonine-protein phosphatase [Gammaproteobacteria bacterium]|nr:PP2C family serine/threonine-protein phosphatase [Gammaproteobacteria bacterium]
MKDREKNESTLSDYGIDDHWHIYRKNSEPHLYREKHGDISRTLFNAIGVREIRGRRPDQEDAFFAFEADAASQGLRKNVLQAVYEKTFDTLKQELNKQLNKKIEGLVEDEKHSIDEARVYKTPDKKLCGGSCALIAGAQSHVDDEKQVHLNAHAANVGDSIAFILVFDTRTGKINKKKSHVLNPFHDGYNEDECKRVKNAGGTIENYRVRHPVGSLAVTRSIGDGTALDKKRGLLAVFRDMQPPKGVSQTPEVTEYAVDLEQHERAFLLVSCDGLLETILVDFFGYRLDSSSESDRRTITNKICDWIKFVIEKEKYDLAEFDPKSFSEMLVYHAWLGDHKRGKRDNEESKDELNVGSNDNITLMVQEIIPDEKAYYMALFDGHGGDGVARFLRKMCKSVFREKLKEELSERNQIITEKLIDYVESHKSETAIVYQKKMSFVIGLLRELKAHPEKNFLQILETVFDHYLAKENMIQVFGQHKRERRAHFVESLTKHRFTKSEDMLIDCLETGIGCSKKEAKKILNQMRTQPIREEEPIVLKKVEEKIDLDEENFIEEFQKALVFSGNPDQALKKCLDENTPLWQFCRIESYTGVHTKLLESGVSAQLIDEILLEGVKNNQVILMPALFSAVQVTAK